MHKINDYHEQSFVLLTCLVSDLKIRRVLDQFFVCGFRFLDWNYTWLNCIKIILGYVILGYIMLGYIILGYIILGFTLKLYLAKLHENSRTILKIDVQVFQLLIWDFIQNYCVDTESKICECNISVTAPPVTKTRQSFPRKTPAIKPLSGSTIIGKILYFYLSLIS